MELDNVAASDIPGFGALQIVPQAIETILAEVLQKPAQAGEPAAGNR